MTEPAPYAEVRGRDIWGQPAWPHVQLQPGDFARGVWAALAITLAEPLRQALHQHAAACPTCQSMGIAHCDEGMALFALLPAGDRVVVA